MSDVVDSVVIGAGVVGLAIARELALAGREVVVLEKNRAIGEETSARNSEVIHGGIYYPTGSLKARLCVDGRRRLYAYCAEKGIAHRRCGKVIVAAHEAQRAKLEALRRTAESNGVADLAWLDAREIAAFEPEVRAVAGLWSPSTGIVDSHALMLALLGDLEAAGGSLALRARVTAGGQDGEVVRLACDVDGDATELRARVVVNAGGLHALDVARLLALPGPPLPEPRYAKGNYFVCHGKSPFAHLVYPVPEDGGLGIHATLDLAGRTRFGPNVQWLPAGTRAVDLDYAVDPRLAATFYGAIRTYWPGIPDGSLEPAYAGVRPKISGPGEPAADFAIRSLVAPGLPRVVQLFGIESPGLTASLAIAAHVAALVDAGA
ncbi:MAG TPA: NAD(P)/FAD-dependent oxidoreductase [Gammaproteobacteria bacterium]|nr:NAD(P)/FAD-dependent oxidoreductase [Gammaproteobacteria bacterium]